MQEKKLDKPRRKYDAEFKRDVLKMIPSGRSVQDISHSLGINSNMIHKWKAQHNEVSGQKGSYPDVVSGSVSDADQEQLRARLSGRLDGSVFAQGNRLAAIGTYEGRVNRTGV